MSADSALINLTSHFLIAMPGLSDELFGRSVVFMCEHSERGALGLVINKPSDIVLSRLFEKVDLPMGCEDLANQPVFQGGPVQTERGFVLHEAIDTGEGGEGESVYASTLSIPGGLEMTTSKDVLEAMASGAGPRKVAGIDPPAKPTVSAAQLSPFGITARTAAPSRAFDWRLLCQ